MALPGRRPAAGPRLLGRDTRPFTGPDTTHPHLLCLPQPLIEEFLWDSMRASLQRLTPPTPDILPLCPKCGQLKGGFMGGSVQGEAGYTGNGQDRSEEVLMDEQLMAPGWTVTAWTEAVQGLVELDGIAGGADTRHSWQQCWGNTAQRF